MRTKRKLTFAASIAALAALLTLGTLQEARRAEAQTDETPPPVHDRISFGMVGITRGQTIRLSVVNAIPYDSAFPPGPTRVALTFLNGDGQLFRNRDGSPVRRVASLEHGQSTFLDLDAGDLQWPPGPTRLQLRAVVNVIPPPQPDSNEVPPPVGDRIMPSVEVFNNATGRTDFVMSKEPGYRRLTSPQPDPPLGQ